MAEPVYKMTVDLSILESLGINLYSNAAAVLSELVANAYDADATEVRISWGGDAVAVIDNGSGMTVKELNDRFLKVGYKKRDNEGTISRRFKRPFMGRKGIGKLSVFSIARSVDVYSTKPRKGTNGFRIEVGELEKAIRAGKPYLPPPVEVPDNFKKSGTAIVLTNLKSKRADLTANALRKRLARRFDVIDQTPPKAGGFAIWVNGKRITYADRQELKQLEFLWEFGEKETLSASVLPTGIKRFLLPNPTVVPGQDWRVRGWIGTAKRPTDLTKDEDAGSLKNIIVLARKRPIQEGIIEKLDFSRIFGNYVTGQIEADFLDLDGGYEDIATSDRQRLIEDDERVVALQKFLRDAFVKASEQWSQERPKKEAVNALDKYPKLKEWVDARPSWQRGAAERMIGTIASLEIEKNASGTAKATLFRSGILAFERVGLRETVDDLEKLSEVTAEELLPLLGAQGVYEDGMWVDILRSRVEAISQFRMLVDADEKEAVLQEHLFKNLWLLDASWERATLSPRMEEDLRKVDPKAFAVDEEGKRIFGRVDIRYATNSGRHVIVELKRYSVHKDVTVLKTQGVKYVKALRSILSQQQRDADNIEVVFVLGKPPGTKEAGLDSPEKYIADTFSSIKGRYVLYDALIENAKNQYQEYLDASDTARQLDDLLSVLEEEIGDD